MSRPREQHSSHHTRRPKRRDVDLGRGLMGTGLEDGDSVEEVREAAEARVVCEDGVVGLMSSQ